MGMAADSSGGQKAPVNQDQGEFNFDAGGDDAGYKLWREAAEEFKREFELRWAVPLGCSVRVVLQGRAKELVGQIQIVNDLKSAKRGKLRIGGTEFLLGEVESLTRLSPPS